MTMTRFPAFHPSTGRLNSFISFFLESALNCSKSRKFIQGKKRLLTYVMKNVESGAKAENKRTLCRLQNKANYL